MILTFLDLDLASHSIPRESGDDPSGARHMQGSTGYSPRERG